MGCLAGKLEPARTGRLGGEYQRRSGVGGGERASLEPKPTSCFAALCLLSSLSPSPEVQPFLNGTGCWDSSAGGRGAVQGGGTFQAFFMSSQSEERGQGAVQRRRKGNFFRENKNRGRVFRQQGAGHRPMGEGSRTEGGWGRESA